jgi:hypothetical protein
MDPIISGLAQYGVLGLWTASLLYHKWQMSKELNTRYNELSQRTQRLDDEMLDLLRENNRLLEIGFKEMMSKLDK